MKILVTGAHGFVGKNLCAELKNIRDGKARCYGTLTVEEVYEYDVENTLEQLERYCAQADFVFNLAGVNRPQDPADFRAGNYGFASLLLDTLRCQGNTCPVMLSSSIQATLTGRFAGSEYGKSKLEGEELFFRYAQETGVKVLVYRFPNLFGKWCRPNYNSVVATFCYNLAHDLPICVNDPAVELELLYIDDLVREMIAALRGDEHHCSFQNATVVPQADGRYCFVPETHRITLGEMAEHLKTFKAQPQTLFMPEMADDSFIKKLYSTYLSYLPKEKVAFPLKMNMDERGSFTELLKTSACGQFSLNISCPGITKGQHWHHSKWEIFIVVSGEALIQQRSIGTDEVVEFRVSGKQIEAVQMLPGYTHNIVNLSETDNLVTVMWANEAFDPSCPDTYYEPVEE